MRPRILLPSVAAALSLALSASPALGAGNITTVAGPGTSGTSGDGGPATQAFIGSDVGVTALPDGSYLIAHQAAAAVRRVFPDGTITTLAGNGVPGYSGDGGPATAAQLDGVSKAVPAPDGGYLIADPNNNAIRRVAPDGTISTVAGGHGAGFSGDGGPATAAQVRFPYDIAFMPDGSYLIAAKDNQRIRRVDTSGNISTVAGGGGAFGDGGPATSAQLLEPSGVTATPDGGYLIADSSQQRIRKVAADGTITTVAGTGTAGSIGDGGPATAAQLNRPDRTVLEADGGFLIAEENGARIRRVAPDGTISTVAGNGTTGFGGDGGPATNAQLNKPIGVAVLPSRDILIADAANNRVRFVDVDTPAPILTGTSPTSPANENAPKILGTAPLGTTVSLFSNDTCSGAPVASGTAADFAATGIAVTVPDNSSTTFHALVTDAGGNSSSCSSSALTYVEAKPALPPPVEGKTVNAVPEKGTVLVKLPGAPKATGHGAAAGFVPLESIGRQLPVGSTLDTTHGTVRLTAATNAHGGKQTGHFNGGLFRFGQTRKNPLTTVSMAGGGLNACSKLPPGGSPKAAKRRRTLFSHVKGHFRGRGRNSAATVRGTIWTMTDTCAGTRTSVKQGTVEVRDFTLRKTIRLRAGHSYLAHAPLRKH